MNALTFVGVKTGLLRDVNATFEAGVHAVLTETGGGGADLVALAAGVTSPRRGRVRVQGKDPYGTPDIRRRVGSLMDEERLPRAHLVREAVDGALRMRGQSAGASEVLGSCGLADWAPRRTASLSASEHRAVALALALSVPDAVLLALHEPLAVAPVPHDVVDRIGEHAARGAVVLCVTTSADEALRLSSRVAVLDAGRFVGRLMPPGGVSDPGPTWVGTSSPRDLTAALRADAAVARVDWDEGRDAPEIAVYGPDTQETALAILRAASKTRAPVHWITERARAPRVAPWTAGGGTPGRVHGWTP